MEIVGAKSYLEVLIGSVHDLWLWLRSRCVVEIMWLVDSNGLTMIVYIARRLPIRLSASVIIAVQSCRVNHD